MEELSACPVLGNGYGRNARMNKRNQFQLVRENGRSIAGRFCVINVLMTPPDGIPKAAFSISKRYSKLAVDRNRARRLFREVYFRLYRKLPIAWVTFIPRHFMKQAKMEEVLEDALSCLKKLGIELQC